MPSTTTPYSTAGCLLGKVLICLGCGAVSLRTWPMASCAVNPWPTTSTNASKNHFSRRVNGRGASTYSRRKRPHTRPSGAAARAAARSAAGLADWLKSCTTRWQWPQKCPAVCFVSSTRLAGQGCSVALKVGRRSTIGGIQERKDRKFRVFYILHNGPMPAFLHEKQRFGVRECDSGWRGPAAKLRALRYLARLCVSAIRNGAQVHNLFTRPARI